jgi:hypothetical protein
MRAIEDNNFSEVNVISDFVLNEYPYNLTFIELKYKCLNALWLISDAETFSEQHSSILLETFGLQVAHFDFLILAGRYHEALAHVWHSMKENFIPEAMIYFKNTLTLLRRNNPNISAALDDLDTDADIDPIGQIIFAFSGIPTTGLKLKSNRSSDAIEESWIGPRKFNFLLTVNDKFFLPSKICIKSLLESCGSDQIDRIIINDTGLSSQNLQDLKSLHESIIILSFEQTSSDYKDHLSVEWQKAVQSKTRALKHCIDNGILPLVMLDSDQFVVGDFTYLLDSQYSCILCKRKEPILRSDGRKLEYNASFFVAMDFRASSFVDRWIRKFEKFLVSGVNPPHETPAMCEVVEELIPSGLLLTLEDEIISSPNNFVADKTLIYHYKYRPEDGKTGNVLRDRCRDIDTAMPSAAVAFLREKCDLPEASFFTSLDCNFKCND